MIYPESIKQLPKLPEEFMCTEHKIDHSYIAQWPLYRQIEELRRSECRCLIDGMYQWYDLVGQFKDEEN